MHSKRRQEFLDNRMAYTAEETVTVNALELCNLLINEERLSREVRLLTNKLSILQALLEVKQTSPTYVHLRG